MRYHVSGRAERRRERHEVRKVGGSPRVGRAERDLGEEGEAVEEGAGAMAAEEGEEGCGGAAGRLSEVRRAMVAMMPRVRMIHDAVVGGREARRSRRGQGR